MHGYISTHPLCQIKEDNVNLYLPAGLFLLVERVEEVPEELAAVLLAPRLEPGRSRHFQELPGREDGALRVTQEGEGRLQPQKHRLRRRQRRR